MLCDVGIQSQKVGCIMYKSLTDWEIFKEKWASCFKKLTPAENGLKFWKEYVDKCNWGSLEQCVDMLSDDYQLRLQDNQYAKEPGLYQLKDMYKKVDPEQRAKKSLMNCSMCSNTGYVMIVRRTLSGVWITCDRKEPIAVGGQDLIGEFAAHCTCSNSADNVPMSHRNENVRNMFGPADNNIKADMNQNIRDYIEECHSMYYKQRMAEDEALLANSANVAESSVTVQS